MVAVVDQLVSLAEQHQLQLEHLPTALSAAVKIVAAAGDISYLQQAQHAAAALGCAAEVQADLHWAAVAGTAAAVLFGCRPEGLVLPAACSFADADTSRQQLLQLWQPALQFWGEGTVSSMTEHCWWVLLAAGADAVSGGQLCQQLLQEHLPPQLLEQLLQDNCSMVEDGNHVGLSMAFAVQQLLVAQMLQQGLLPQLQPSLVAELLQAALAKGSTVQLGDTFSILDAALQQGAPVEASTVHLLGARLQTDAAAQGTFIAFAKGLAGTPAAAAGQALLCELLCAPSTPAGDASFSWHTYQMLPELGPWDQVPQQQLLQACSVLIKQQGRLQESDTLAGQRLLDVWEQACAAADSSAAGVRQLGSSACQHVLTALAAAGEQQQALEVVQLEPLMLPHLVQLWQRLPQQQSVAAVFVVQALQLCVAGGTAQAAVAADLLLPQLDAPAAAAAFVQDTGLLQQLMQLLCQHSRVAAVLQLLAVALAAVQAGAMQQANALPSALAAVAAVAGSSSSAEDVLNQQQQLVQLLSSSAESQQVAIAALSRLLSEAAPAAACVGLFLHGLQQGGHTNLAAVLQPAELQQLCALLSSSSSTTTAPKPGAGSVGLLSLPSAYALAKQCIQHSSAGDPVLSPTAAAQLANALAVQHPDLQPSTAAAPLGLFGPVASGAGLATVTSVGAPELANVSLVLAQLCYQQLQALTASVAEPDDTDELESALAQWVAKLSPEAAAAGLLAVWAHSGLAAVAPSARAGSAGLQAPGGGALPLLCVELYSRAKAAGDSLVFDLGLVAAAEAAGYTGNWHRGKQICSRALTRQCCHGNGRHMQDTKIITHASFSGCSVTWQWKSTVVVVRAAGCVLQAKASLLLPRKLPSMQATAAAKPAGAASRPVTGCPHCQLPTLPC
jgi:hypothetical protein